MAAPLATPGPSQPRRPREITAVAVIWIAAGIVGLVANGASLVIQDQDGEAWRYACFQLFFGLTFAVLGRLVRNDQVRSLEAAGALSICLAAFFGALASMSLALAATNPGDMLVGPIAVEAPRLAFAIGLLIAGILAIHANDRFKGWLASIRGPMPPPGDGSS